MIDLRHYASDFADMLGRPRGMSLLKARWVGVDVRMAPRPEADRGDEDPIASMEADGRHGLAYAMKVKRAFVEMASEAEKENEE